MRGTDVTLISYNKMVLVAMEAAEKLEAEGISAEVIDLRTIRPLDRETIVTSVKKTQSRRSGRRGLAVRRGILRGSLRDPEGRLRLPRRPRSSALIPPRYEVLGYAPTLVEEFLPNADKVIRAVKEVAYVS